MGLAKQEPEEARGWRISRAKKPTPQSLAPSALPTTMEDLDLAIRNGFGDTPQSKLPKDWRTHRKGASRDDA
jgi:hypothetical protein